ncbi:MAG TPA: ATP-binding protein [Gemmatimonadaceae bacterium]|nr:ATP-binding protein [Gemmatimonadaceae bacterium]
MRLSHRLLLSTLFVVGVLVLIVVAVSGRRLSAELNRLTVDQLSREARLIAAEWRDEASADSVADVAGLALGHRVTLIDSAGRVVGDSHFDGDALARLENHAGRPEVRAIRDGADRGVATRVSASAGDNELYVAVPAARGVSRVAIGTRQLDTIVAQARRDVLLSGALAILVALVLAIAISRDVSRPIEELRDVTQALAAGDLSRRPALSAPGEVGDLAAAIHRMAEQLGARLRALQADDELMGALVDALHEGVVAVNDRRDVVRINEVGRQLLGSRHPTPFSVDLLPRERALREALAIALAGGDVERDEVTIGGRTLALTALPLANGGAVVALYDLTETRRLELVRRDFVANVSHELKTPLTVIGGFAETLESEELTDTQRRQFVDAILTNARRMQRIVDDLLDLSRIESGGWRPNPAVVDVRGLAGELIAASVPEAKRKNISLKIDMPDAAEITADPTALRQILSNLVDNALRYTGEGGTMTIFSAAEPNGVRVGVRDTGVGIAPEHLPRIFERFYRVDTGRSRNAGGTGLGLAIVRHLCDAHGARVSADSVLGKGTTVSVFFPKNSAAL